VMCHMCVLCRVAKSLSSGDMCDVSHACFVQGGKMTL
jgi:hypothetical protein